MVGQARISACRYLASTVLFLVISGLLICTAIMAASYAGSKGTDEPTIIWITTRQINICVALILEIAAALFPLFLIWNLRDGRWLMAFVCLVGCVFFGVVSYANALGFMGMSRSEADANRAQAADGYAGLVAERDRLVMQRGLVAKHAPVETIAARIEEAEASKIFLRTANCTAAKITRDDSTEFCDKYRALKADLVAAGSAEQLSEKIVQIDAKIAARKNVIQGDSLAGMLHSLVGFEENKTNQLAPVAISLGAFFLVLAGFAVAETGITPARTAPVRASSEPVHSAPKGLAVVNIQKQCAEKAHCSPAPALEASPEKRQDAALASILPSGKIGAASLLPAVLEPSVASGGGNTTATDHLNAGVEIVGREMDAIGKGNSKGIPKGSISPDNDPALELHSDVTEFRPRPVSAEEGLRLFLRPKLAGIYPVFVGIDLDRQETLWNAYKAECARRRWPEVKQKEFSASIRKLGFEVRKISQKPYTGKVCLVVSEAKPSAVASARRKVS